MMRTMRIRPHEKMKIGATLCGLMLGVLCGTALAQETPLQRQDQAAAPALAERRQHDRSVDGQILRLRRKIEADPARPHYIFNSVPLASVCWR
jgi:DNA-binding response OmpR family regulator